MRVGSLVRCDKASGYDEVIGVKTPKVGSIYTVRGFWKLNHPNPLFRGLYLEEIVNGVNMFGVEPSFLINDFTELLPLEDSSLEELCEEINENKLKIV